METNQNIQAKYETTECVICFDEFSDSNICITPCGHKFCFKCLMKHMNKSDTCPCCRELLKEEELHDDSSESSESSEDEDYEDYEVESNYNFNHEYDFNNFINIGRHRDNATPKQITEELMKLNYTMEDIIVLWTWRVDRTERRYSQNFIKKLWSDLEDIVGRLDDEITKQYEETILMEMEDKIDTTIINLHEIFNDE